jgi:hypothetical protein
MAAIERMGLEDRRRSSRLRCWRRRVGHFVVLYILAQRQPRD